MRWTLTLLAIGILLAGCGGGSSKSSEPVETRVISGQVTGSVVERVLLTLGGDGFAQIESDSFGSFAFPPVPPGTYSITPSLEDVTFLPPNRIVIVSTVDVVGVDFVSSGTPPALDANPPASPVRLVVIHHSDGTNWVKSDDGGLADALGANNYYVRDVSYSWDAPQNTDIGNQTDIGQWYSWFADTTLQANAVSVRDNICGALYTTNMQTASYTPIADPGGDNDIVVFMSSFPNSAVQSDNAQPPSALYGQPAASNAHTLSNCKAVYNELLAYFKTRTDKLFVVVTAPPLVSSATFLTDAANARALNDWLVNTWLVAGGWEKRNVAVFDFFNVLTDVDNHHYVFNGAIEHVNTNGDDFAYYGQGGDSHPTQLGNLKGTAEFLPLLNVAYNRWKTAYP